MKAIKWNLGIMVIWFGYRVRQRHHIGRMIVKWGYTLRGEIPHKTWKWNHV